LESLNFFLLALNDSSDRPLRNALIQRSLVATASMMPISAGQHSIAAVPVPSSAV
jgi:hypothetical protein